MLVALDIETKCALNCQEKCGHALSPNTNQISIIGLWSEDFSTTFTDLLEFNKFVSENKQLKFVGHNLKFDLRNLSHHGVEIEKDRWAHDTQLMASCCLSKVPQAWLNNYEVKRKELNKTLPRGYSHREVKGQSLKTLAPYFLNVDPFWEDPTNHASESYVLKDCEYTYRLCQLFLDKMAQDGTLKFYQDKLLNWTKTLLVAEERGIKLDTTRLYRKTQVAERRASDLKKKLDQMWAPAYKEYRNLLEKDIVQNYIEMTEAALVKLKNPTKEKIEKTEARYKILCEKALSKHIFDFNINSDDQMLWLLRDYFKLDTKVRNRDKDTNEITIKDSTGVEVLQRLAVEREDIKLLLDYREYNKLATAFYPAYQEMKYLDDTIHATFNSTGTRTGRLSSSDPNLQQVPGHLHSLFKARSGYKIACFDESGIEARLIAYFSEDPVLCDLIINNKDIHAFHASIFFDTDEKNISKKSPERQLAKNIGFGLFYGAGPNRIKQEAMRSGYSWTDDHCFTLFKRFKKTYKGVFDYKSSLDNDALDSPISSLFGRLFKFLPEDIHMKCFNSVIQGSASDLVLNSANRTMDQFKQNNIDGHFLIAVHDELVFEIAENDLSAGVEILRHCMTDYKLSTIHGNIPLAVEGRVGRCWAK